MRGRPARRLAALVVATLLLALLVCWLRRAPESEAAPAPAPAPASSLAASAAPRARSAPVVVAAASAVAASPAASAWSARETALHCGVNQRPQPAAAGDDDDADDGAAFGERRPGKSAGPAWHAELARIDAALRTSSEPYDRAVADWLDPGERLPPALRVESVAEMAATTTDPRLYALGVGACKEQDEQAPSCTLLTARRWAELDAGNAVPWLVVLAQAVAADDARLQAEALAQMASADRFQDRLHDAAAVVVAHAAPADEGLAADLDLAERAFRKSVAQSEFPNALIDVCTKAVGDAARVRQCAAIGELMARHGDSLLARALGAGVYRRATGDPSLRDAIRAEHIAMAPLFKPATGASDCRTVREGLQLMRRGAQLGELEAFRALARDRAAP